MPGKIDLTDKHFTRLTVIREAGRSNGHVLWECRCACGTERHVVYGGDLRSGKTLSCGCWQRERPITHGMCKGGKPAPEYQALNNAQNRCTNPKCREFKNYGGRGIEFLFPSTGDAVVHVVAAIGRRPPGMSIDRIDNDGNYEIGNLRWATRSQQARNQRQRKKVSPAPSR